MFRRVRFLPGSMVVLALSLPLVLGLGVLVFVLVSGPAAGVSTPARAAPALPPVAQLPAPAGLLVEVTGAVARPGLYRLPRGERVAAAIAAAGGVLDGADPNKMPDLAARLKDGQQVRVPFLRGSASSGVHRVNLNEATEEMLLAIPGFSLEIAVAAVRQRELFGGFSSTHELVSVLGMSEADYAIARSYLTV